MRKTDAATAKARATRAAMAAVRATLLVMMAATAGAFVMVMGWLQHWQHSKKVNEDNNNSMTTTQQPTQHSTRQPTRQPTQRRNRIEWPEQNYVFFSVQICLDPWTVPARPLKVPFSGLERYVLFFYVKKLCLWT